MENKVETETTESVKKTQLTHYHQFTHSPQSLKKTPFTPLSVCPAARPWDFTLTAQAQRFLHRAKVPGEAENSSAISKGSWCSKRCRTSAGAQREAPSPQLLLKRGKPVCSTQPRWCSLQKHNSLDCGAIFFPSQHSTFSKLAF